MKRPLAFVGFSMATALLLINIIGGMFYKILFVLAAVLFVVSLLVTKLRQARVALCVFGAALLACLIFMANYSNVEGQMLLDNQEVKTVFHIVDNVQVNDGEYIYTVKTKSIDYPGAPQNIKLKLYSEYEIDADYYDDLLSVIKYSKSYSDAFSSYGAFADGRYIFASLDTVPIPLNNNDKPINYYILKARDYIKNTITQVKEKVKIEKNINPYSAISWNPKIEDFEKEEEEISKKVISSGVTFSFIYSISPFFGVTKYCNLSCNLLSGFLSIQYLPSELSTIYLTTQSVVNN